MVASNVTQQAAVEKENFVSKPKANHHDDGKYLPPRPSPTPVNVRYTTQLTRAEDENVIKHSSHGRRQTFKYFAIIFSVIAVISPVLAFVFKLDLKNISGLETVNSNTFDRNPTVKVSHLYINWGAMNKMNTANSTVNFTWKLPNNSFLELDQSGELIFVKENGTYFIQMFLNLDSSDKKDHSLYSAVFCIKNNRNNKEKCIRERIFANFAISTSVDVTLLLGNRNYFWVTCTGYDLIYNKTSLNGMTITVHPVYL